MKRVYRKLTGTVLLTTILGTMLITNAQAAHAQPLDHQVAAVAIGDGPQCRPLTATEMAGVQGTGWADWAVRLIDLGCVSGSAVAAARLTSPFVGAFCAGWAIGRYIGG
jgi:hypothetical protein